MVGRVRLHTVSLGGSGSSRRPASSEEAEEAGKTAMSSAHEDAMTSLLNRLLRRSDRAEHLTFTVYTRAQCCCCHKALDLLRDYQKQFHFALEEVDIDG